MLFACGSCFSHSSKHQSQSHCHCHSPCHSQPFDGRRREQWQLQPWSGGTSSGGVPASDGSSTRFLRADGLWAIPPGSGGGTRWWSGEGPPGQLPDAQAGDFYLDTRSGDLYTFTA